MRTHILCETVADSIRVARFLRPDVRDVLYDHENISETTLYQELRQGAIDTLIQGGTLILNFGLIDWFPTAFYRVMIQALQDARARGCRILVCCLPENVKEGFEMMGGARLFEVHSTEARAIASVAKKK